MLALLALTVLSTGPISAKDGRDFAGYYSLTNVSESGSQVQFTLSLQLFNYSGADLQNAAITVQSGEPRPDLLGSFPPIKVWRNGSDVIVSRQITVARYLFERWSSRLTPAVFIAPGGENGYAHRRPAQLSRRPMLPPPHPAAE